MLKLIPLVIAFLLASKGLRAEKIDLFILAG